MTSLTERYAAKIVGTLSCYDRVIIQGTLAGVGYAPGMTGYLKGHGIRVFDFAKVAEPITDAIPSERREHRRRARDEDRAHSQG